MQLVSDGESDGRSDGRSDGSERGREGTYVVRRAAHFVDGEIPAQHNHRS